MEYKLNNILVPTDFSNSANKALKIALQLALLHKAKLHILHVVEPITLGIYDNTRVLIYDTQSKILNSAFENLKLQKEQIYAIHKIDIEIKVSLGIVHNVINQYCILHQINLVTMGTHGISGFKELFTGSNSYEVIKQVSCPVLTIPETFKYNFFQNILYPVRVVPGVYEKYDFLKPFLIDKKCVIQILGLLANNIWEEIKEMENIIKKIEVLVGNDFDKIKGELLFSKDCATTVLKYVEDNNFDLVIINATLDKKWYSFFKGNYTQKIINHSKTPILAIKPILTVENVELANQYLVAEANFYEPLDL